MVRGELFGVLLVASSMTASVNLVDGPLAIEQSSSLFQTKALGFDDKEITEARLKGEPAAVYDL